MKIIFYSDSKYEYQAKSLIESALLNIKEEFELIYYTIDFESSLDYTNLTTVFYKKDSNMKRFEFYKPAIMLDAISKFGGNFIFLDTDVIVGRRFKISKFFNDSEIPLFPYGNWDYPFVFDGMNPDGTHKNFCNEQVLMEYFGVAQRSMNYIYTCVCSFNDKCVDILLEWKSMCENVYLLQNIEKYYPFKDETPMNVILWKRGIQVNLGRVYLNTIQAYPLVHIEENEGVVGDAYNMGIFENPNMKCENSSEIMLYHGIKDAEELNLALRHMNPVYE